MISTLSTTRRTFPVPDRAGTAAAGGAVCTSRSLPLRMGQGFASSSPRDSSPSQSKQQQRTGYTGAKALRQSANRYDKFRQQTVVSKQEEEGPNNVHKKKLLSDYHRDIYARSPLNSPTTFWFVGKVMLDPQYTRASNALFSSAILSHKRLILDYTKNQLRPQNFALPKYQNTLELWFAPGDSEMDVVQNKIQLERVEVEGGTPASGIPTTVPIDAVGYNPEVYVGDERAQGGLRVERDEEGRPIKPVFEVNESV